MCNFNFFLCFFSSQPEQIRISLFCLDRFTVKHCLFNRLDSAGSYNAVNVIGLALTIRHKNCKAHPFFIVFSANNNPDGV